MKPIEIIKQTNAEQVTNTFKTKRLGIYMIICEVNGRGYVGQSRNLYERIKQYRYCLENNKGENAYLNKYYSLYGMESLKFYILKECEKLELTDWELHFYNLMDDECRMNCRKPNFQRDMTPEEIQRAVLGRKKNGPVSQETRAKLSKKLRGLMKSEVTKQRISAALSGKPKKTMTKGKIVTAESAKEIKKLIKDGVLSYKQIAAQMKTSISTISDIANCRTWAEIR